MKNKLWGGRFKKKADPFMEKFTSSIGYDKRLADVDCLGSIAHSEMLGKCGIIPKKDSAKIVSGLKSILKDIEKNTFKYDLSEEDIHSCIQNELYKRIGEPALKLHTARSRNDQVALDTRMYCKKEIFSIDKAVLNFKKSIVQFVNKNTGAVIPGLTHMQNAQPVLLGHHMMAYCEMLDRDSERLSDCLKRVDVMPLGSCAISGTSLPIDRKFTAKKLGFSKVSSNSMDAVSDRDFVMELIFALSVLSMHLSRLSEDLIIWNSQGFGFLEIADEFCTGSSMMPQKKNPDVLELVRGKSGVLYGALVNILTVMKGLPLTYNRDMQEDKEPLFKAIDTVKDSLAVLALFFKDLKIKDTEAKQLLKDDGIYATDMMEYLVKKGAALKDSHDIIGKIMLYLAHKRLKMSEISLTELRGFSPLFNEDVYDLFDADNSVRLKKSYGGTSPEQLKRQVRDA
jgi:argininosuccinate lyase